VKNPGTEVSDVGRMRKTTVGFKKKAKANPAGTKSGKIMGPWKKKKNRQDQGQENSGKGRNGTEVDFRKVARGKWKKKKGTDQSSQSTGGAGPTLGWGEEKPWC